MVEGAGKPVECVRVQLIVGFIAGVLFFLAALAAGYQFSESVVDSFVPLRLVRIPEGWTVSNPIPKGIEVCLHGPRYIASRLNAFESVYELDLSGAPEGTTMRDLHTENLRIPAGLSIRSMHPGRVSVRLEKQMQKQLPVIVCFSGKPAAGFIVDGFAVNPPMIILKGAQNILSQLQSAASKPVRIDGFSESFKLEIVLDIADGLERVDGQGGLSATISIIDQMLVKKFTGLRVMGKGAEYRYVITPEFLDIAVQGPFRLVSGLSPDRDISLTLMLEGLKPGVYVRRATIEMPVGISLIDVKPELFTVRIINEKSQENQP